MRAAILTLYNFVLHYSGWTDLGNGIAMCINSAITNIPWLEAGLGVSGFAIGLLNALIAAVQGTSWNDLGHNIVTMIAAIDWPGSVLCVEHAGIGCAAGHQHDSRPS